MNEVMKLGATVSLMNKSELDTFRKGMGIARPLTYVEIFQELKKIKEPDKIEILHKLALGLSIQDEMYKMGSVNYNSDFFF